jgi:hypothetical protein
MNIKIIKLTNGEELIANVKDDNNSYVVLSEPQRIAITEEGVGFVPFSYFSEDKEIPMDKKNILAILNPNTDILNGYNERFGSGIVSTGGPSNLII